MFFHKRECFIRPYDKIVSDGRKVFFNEIITCECYLWKQRIDEKCWHCLLPKAFSVDSKKEDMEWKGHFNHQNAKGQTPTVSGKGTQVKMEEKCLQEGGKKGESAWPFPVNKR